MLDVGRGVLGLDVSDMGFRTGSDIFRLQSNRFVTPFPLRGLVSGYRGGSLVSVGLCSGMLYTQVLLVLCAALNLVP